MLGPVAGGFIAERVDVKFVFITLTGLCGFAAVAGTLCLVETYGPVIRVRLAQKSSNPETVQSLEQVLHMDQHSQLLNVWNSITRPLVYLTCSFICESKNVSNR